MYSGTDLSVVELNTSVKELLQIGFPGEFWVRGVVTGLRRVSGRGHTYFQLADPSNTGEQSPAVVDCALYSGDRSSIAVEAGREGVVFDLLNNTEVRIRAAVSFWERSGRFQIVMKGFDHTFSGDSSAIHLQKLVTKLSAEGVLQENSTLDMPSLSLTVGLVTSKDSAAEKDFVKTLEESGYPFRVYAAWAYMQGSETADSVCSAFTRLLMSSVSEEIDAVVLTRGGGSATDLAWFNDERIARTIAQLPWPVISGIGHEIDTTLPDHAAHTRAKTPSHAASLLVDRVAAFDDSVSRMSRGLVSAFAPRIQVERMLIDRIAAVLSNSLSALPLRKREELQRIVTRLRTAVTGRVHLCEKELASLENRLDMRNPQKMLALGWAVVRNQEGRPLGNAGSISKGDRISVSMQGGMLKALVEENIHD
jgi:exodeoxyribonuclease VII large subunit